MTDIKVGSEWMLKVREERRCKILYVGKEVLFAEWNSGAESEYKISDFLAVYKPAPVRRTVWLNVYETWAEAFTTKSKADDVKAYNLLWQQEVELIDPRGGE